MTIGFELNHTFIRASVMLSGFCQDIQNMDGYLEFPYEKGEINSLRKALNDALQAVEEFESPNLQNDWIILAHPLDFPYSLLEIARIHLLQVKNFAHVRTIPLTVAAAYSVLQNYPDTLSADRSPEMNVMVVDTKTEEAAVLSLGDGVLEVIDCYQLPTAMETLKLGKERYESMIILNDSGNGYQLEDVHNKVQALDCDVYSVSCNIAAGAAFRGECIYDVLELGVLPVSIGIKKRDDEFHMLIESGTTIPCKAVHTIISESELYSKTLTIRYGTDQLGYEEISFEDVGKGTLTIDIDANGFIQVTAPMASSGSSQVIKLSLEIGRVRYRDPYRPRASFLTNDDHLEQLTLMDDLERSIRSINDSLSEQISAGLEDIQERFAKLLKRQYDIRSIPSLHSGFDPNIHCAVEHTYDSSSPENMVSSEWKKGYAKSGSILRIADVGVVN